MKCHEVEFEAFKYPSESEPKIIQKARGTSIQTLISGNVTGRILRYFGCSFQTPLSIYTESFSPIVWFNLLKMDFEIVDDNTPNELTARNGFCNQL